MVVIVLEIVIEIVIVVDVPNRCLADRVVIGLRVKDGGIDIESNCD